MLAVLLNECIGISETGDGEEGLTHTLELSELAQVDVGGRLLGGRVLPGQALIHTGVGLQFWRVPVCLRLVFAAQV